MPGIELAGTDYRRLVSRAASLLAQSADFDETLAQTLLGCLPGLGDFGFFDAHRGIDVVRVARAHDDESTEAILRPTKWVRQERSAMNLCALSTGKPALHADVDDDWYQAVATSPEHLDVLRRLAFCSMVTVPMRHRGELIGALTLFMGRSARRHGEDHMAMLVDLAGIAAPVVANAALVERHREDEARLRASQQRLELAMQAASLGTWEWAVEEGTVHWSPEYRDICGFTRDEPPTFERGMSVVSPDQRAFVAERMTEAAAAGSNVSFEHRIQHPTRGERWIQTLGRAQRVAGRTTHLHGVVVDITERKRHEGELLALREELALELGALRRLHAIGTRVVRREDRLDDVLQEILDAALEITGRSQGSIRLVDEEADVMRLAAQRGFSRDYLEQYREIHRDAPMAIAAAWRTGRRVLIEDTASHVADADGISMRAIRALKVGALQSTPLVSRDGRIIGVFTTHSMQPEQWGERELRLLDLLSREAADLVEQARAQALLHESDRRKNEFLAILAHELRNPIAPIRYAASIGLSAVSTPEQKARACETIERQAKHMAHLLDDLLDISRIERGAVKLKKERVRVAEIVSAALEATGALTAAKRHRIVVDAPAELAVTGDAVRLTQILTNLVSNAAKYSDAGGEIRVSAAPEGGQVRLSVRDTGIGISADLRPRLFTLFGQGDAAQHRGEGGLGIGLALVSAFAKLHGGTVAVNSEGAGKGSEFVVMLPGSAAPATPHIAPAAPKAARSGGPLVVVIADDNSDIAETCAMLVDQWGHQSHTALSGEAALELVHRLRPDVAILDIGMPGMNGYEVAKRVRAEAGSGITLVAVTGWGQEEDRQRSRDAGFDIHLTKPVDVDELQETIERIAAKRPTAAL